MSHKSNDNNLDIDKILFYIGEYMNDDPGPSKNQSLFNKLTSFLSQSPGSIHELISYLKDAERQHLINHETSQMIQGVLDVSSMQVREVMIPKNKINTIQNNASYSEIANTFAETGHSRMPVIDNEDSNKIIGMLYARDILTWSVKTNKIIEQNFDIEELIHPCHFIPESKRLNVLLREFKDNQKHIAIVVDEYGNPSGLVSTSDILEQIVGDLDDSDEEIESLIKKSTTSLSFIVKSMTSLEDFNQYFQTKLSDESFDTIGGFVANRFGYLPQRGERIIIGSFEFEILKSDSRSVQLLELRPVKESTVVQIQSA